MERRIVGMLRHQRPVIEIALKRSGLALRCRESSSLACPKSVRNHRFLVSVHLDSNVLHRMRRPHIGPVGAELLHPTYARVD